MSPLKFAKGGSSSKSAVRTPDSLVSTDTVEVLLGISEGPIKGLVDGARTFRADDTPLENTSGDANFENFELDVWPGSELGHTVIMDLGGFSNPLNIGVTLAQNTPVVRSGTVRGIDAADFRIVVQQLLTQKDDGVYKADLSLKFEIKKKTDAAWRLAWVSDLPNVGAGGGAAGGGGGSGGIRNGNSFNVLNFASDAIDNGDYETWRSFGRVNDLLTFEGDTQTVVTAGAPVAPPEDPTLPAVGYDENNPDLIYHWSSGGGWQVESPPQDPGGNYTILADGRRQYPLSAVPPTGARPGDLWLRLQLIKVIPTVWNGSAWVLGSEYRAATPPIPASGVWTTNAKVSSPTAKDIRVFLPDAGPDDEWEYRVTKLSPDSGTEVFSVVQWESVQEISRTPMHFQGVALARVIGRASDQFTSLPNWNGDWLGRVVKLPSNYNPVTRTYTGVWDGTYKIDWTDNNAFIFQDFVENTRYGLSSVFPHTVNKWSIYEFGRHCDTMVDRPDGTKRPRWTYNDYIQEPRDAKELAQYIAGSAGARYVDDGNGIVEVIVDRDTPAVAIFTPENVGEDGFSYSYTDRLTRANEITIEFINPDLNWNRDKRIVRMDDDIATYGRIPENFIAVGCIDADEALARGRRRLIGGLTEKELVTFKTNRKGKFLSEWDVILIGDPAMGRGITGRIRQVIGPRGVTLRDPLTFEPGVEYWATFDVVNPDYPENSSAPFRTERRQITNGAGNEQRLLTFASDLPNLAGYAAFVIEADGIAGYPKPYRITSISDDSGSGDDIQISALELNRNKWGYIDTGVDQGVINYSQFSTGAVLSPTNPRLTPSVEMRGNIPVRVLTLAWDPPASKWVRRHKVYHSVDGVPTPTYEPQGYEVRVDNAMPGIHTFSIIAVDIRGRESLPITLSYNLRGEAVSMPGATGLRLVGGITPTTFDTIDAQFEWDAPPPSPTFSHFLIQVLHKRPDVIPEWFDTVRTVDVGTNTRWTYAFGEQQVDGQGLAWREFSVKVIAVDQFGGENTTYRLDVSNPPPLPVPVAFQPAPLAVYLRFSQPTATDYAGICVWSSTQPGFTPSDANLVWDGGGSPAVPAVPLQKYYFRYAFFDYFGKDGVIVSDEFEVETPALEVDVEIPDLEEIRDEIDIIKQDGLLVRDQLSQSANTMMLDILGRVKEAKERDRLAYLEGAPLGPIVRNEVVKTTDMVQTLDLLGIKTPSGGAFVLNLDTVKYSNGQTLAEKFQLIEAEGGGANAAISYLNQALIDEVSARTLQVNTATSQWGTNLALAKTEQKTYTDALRSYTDSTFTQASTYNGFVATTDQKFSTQASALGAVAEFQQLLGVKNANGSAIILNTDTVRLSTTESLSERLSLVENRFGGSSSSYLLTSVTGAASSAQSALTTLTQMGATIGNGSAFQMDSSRVVAGPGELLSQRLSSIQADRNGEGARVDSKITASVGPGGVVSSWIGAAYSTKAQLEAAAGFSFESIGGVMAKSQLYANANGVVSVIQAGVDQGVGTLKFAASEMYFVDNSGFNPVSILNYTNGQWVMNANIRFNGTVSFDQMVAGTLNSTITMGSGRIIFNNGTWMRVQGMGFGSGNQFIDWFGPTMAIGSCNETNGINWMKQNGESQWGGPTLSGPFDSGPGSSTIINLPKDAWTTITSINRGMATAGMMWARLIFQIYVTGSQPDPNEPIPNPGGNVDYRLLITNLDGSEAVIPFSSVGAYFPGNQWIYINGLPGALVEMDSVVLPSRGVKKISLQLNPNGGLINTAQVRQGRIRGLYGA